ncbi:hypothetical protein MPF19_00710 [Polaribacter sp. Z014]|uniref:hypothetical protein n=1 Tax=Polaribacter sp. Z014 TaxID=2927126 RepID=UPI002020A10C|nr:hypothetical protein [Polaribacter sp. Z014]MCL7761915.1 hypothetical protein [Polaribacter sp. Z014]
MNKIKLTLAFFLLISLESFAHSEVKQSIYRNGIGMGSVIAIVISWSKNKSVLYAILHGVLSWLYVIYYIINREDKEKNN